MWSRLSDEQIATNVIGDVEGLTDEDVEEIFLIWQKGDYEDSDRGRKQAFAELQDLALNRVLKNKGMLEAAEENWYGK